MSTQPATREPLPLVYDWMTNQYEARCPECRELLGALTEERVARQKAAGLSTPLIFRPATHECTTERTTP